MNKELTTTTPIVENSEQETGEAIENGNLTPLATDIANISIQMKNINDRFDQISTESKQFKEINSECSIKGMSQNRTTKLQIPAR